MPYCYNCGAEVNADASFCKACGNKIETGKPVQAIPAKTTPAQTFPEYVPPPPPPFSPPPPPLPPPPLRQTPVVGYATQTSYPSNKSKPWLTLFIVALVLLVAVGAILGFSYANASGKLKTTKDTLATTKQKVTSLQDDKTSLEGNLADVNSTLASTQQTLSSTQGTLTSTQGELTSTKTQLTSTQSQLSTSQSSLATAQNQISGLNTQLASSQSTITTLQNQIAASKLKYFANLAALTTWVNSQPIFNTAYIYDDSVSLQNLALKQGYLLFADVEADTNGIYYVACKAYCADGYVYYINARNHQVWIDHYEGSEPTP
jgi:uncharacterized coiled-coil protein SlyX